MEYVYKTQGTCSTNIELNVEDGVVKEVAFWGGCNGNLQGISRLVRAPGFPIRPDAHPLKSKAESKITVSCFFMSLSI